MEDRLASRPLRTGILGAANIARSFINGVAPSKTVTIAAVASRDAAKAERFAKECGIARAHGSYDALLADSTIDAVYNPLPNTMHAEWSIRAIEAGKHVLCEKPLATTAADARAMFASARRHNVHLVEAYPYRAQPQTLKLVELLTAANAFRSRTTAATTAIHMSGPPRMAILSFVHLAYCIPSAVRCYFGQLTGTVARRGCRKRHKPLFSPTNTFRRRVTRLGLGTPLANFDGSWPAVVREVCDENPDCRRTAADHCRTRAHRAGHHRHAARLP